jgi:Xaa-Pro dipeptidase
MDAMYKQHVAVLQERYEETLRLLAEQDIYIDAVVIHSGTETNYYLDDKEVPFLAHAQFNHWVPINRPDQMVLIVPGETPRYFQEVKDDFWFDQVIDNASWWADCFDIIQLKSAAEVMDHLPAGIRRIAFLGANTDFAAAMGFPSGLHNEGNLRNRLDYHRSLKTPYEVETIKAANVMALKGHAAAEVAFHEFKSEKAIHQAYINACGVTDHDLPYHNIVGLDEKSAILHYQNRRETPGTDSQVLLVDGGYRLRCYAADITRTFVRETTHPVFYELSKRVNQLQLDLVDLCKVGNPYEDLHKATLSATLDILIDLDLVRGDRDEAEEAGIHRLFFPHGVGHMLGLQVHDVGGFFADETGVLLPPQSEHKHLRMTRTLEDGMVYTIEPGIYFIPVLLNPEREGEKAGMLNWSLIDELLPLGGARFEDNVLITSNGPVNLTR